MPNKTKTEVDISAIKPQRKSKSPHKHHHQSFQIRTRNLRAELPMSQDMEACILSQNYIERKLSTGSRYGSIQQKQLKHKKVKSQTVNSLPATPVLPKSNVSSTPTSRLNNYMLNQGGGQGISSTQVSMTGNIKNISTCATTVANN